MCQPNIMANEHALTAWRNSQKPIVTQEALASALGTSRWWINRLETGERTPSFELAVKIETITKGKVTGKDFVREQSREAAQ